MTKRSMSLPEALLVSIAVLLLVPLAGAGDGAQALGTWDIVASTPDGDIPSVLTLSDVEGVFTAEIEIGGAKREVSDEALADGVLTLKVQYEGTLYDVEAKLDGDAMEGTWTGGGNSGTLKAKRRS